MGVCGYGFDGGSHRHSLWCFLFWSQRGIMVIAQGIDELSCKTEKKHVA